MSNEEHGPLGTTYRVVTYSRQDMPTSTQYSLEAACEVVLNKVLPVPVSSFTIAVVHDDWQPYQLGKHRPTWIARLDYEADGQQGSLTVHVSEDIERLWLYLLEKDREYLHLYR